MHLPPMRVIPDEIRSADAGAVRFRIMAEMVERFAELTGDRSALHVSEAFARRSAYRRPVVHGMLPVAFIALIDRFHLKGHRCIPLALSGHFSAPVYIGDRLVLTAGAAQLQERKDAIDFTYVVRHEASGAVATRGIVTVAYEREPPAKKSSATAVSAAMLPNPPEMQNARLEDIDRGQTDAFDFRITGGTLRAFADLLAAGAGKPAGLDVRILQDQFHLPNLLSILLFSTSVGICLPGASATFLEFSAEADAEAELDTLYRLQAEVAHRSLSTRIVKKSVTICEAGRKDRVFIRGKVSALVSAPSGPMPTMQELKASALDAGLKGKVVLITGASRGVGETTAKLFGLLGAKVIVNYHRGAEDAARIVGEIRAEGGDAVAAPADVSRPDEVSSLVRLAAEKFGTIHILVNNAVRDYRPIAFLNLTWDEIQKDLDVVGKGAFLCCQHVIPLMLAQGEGKIINISSVAVDNPPAEQTKYVMAKSALVGLTRSLSVEYAARNIQVNLVVPNFVETDLVAHIPDGFRRKIARDTPMQRLASPVEVAQAVVFLASSFSSFTTGQKIMVTGGGAPYL
jgi:3-oxoacyl-[acyl-carrier protein] reductase